jgi:hypothetical protein
LHDNPPCLEIGTMLCEDTNDKIAGCDDALIHESPILFLKLITYLHNRREICLCW